MPQLPGRHSDTLQVIRDLCYAAGSRPFAIRLPDGTPLQSVSFPEFTYILRRPDSVRRALFPPSFLAVGEAFINGDIDVEGDLEGAVRHVFELLTSPRFYAKLVRHIPRLAYLRTGPRAVPGNEAKLEGQLHQRERDIAAIRYHYDLSNSFYELWLGRRMIYSCAYFPPGIEDLDAAQEAKLDLICRKLQLSPGQRLLDIGCGWGGLAIYAAENYGVEVLGVTISEQQAVWAREAVKAHGLERAVTIDLLDYRDLRGNAEFDKVASVGMFEHVGRSNFPVYFETARRLLKPGGLFLNHSIHRPLFRPRIAGWIGRVLLGSGQLGQKYFFPDGQLVDANEAMKAAKRAGFTVRGFEEIGHYYPPTLRHWLRRLDEREEQAVQEVGSEMYRARKLLFAAAAVLFTKRMLGVHQLLLARDS